MDRTLDLGEGHKLSFATVVQGTPVQSPSSATSKRLGVRRTSSATYVSEGLGYSYLELLPSVDVRLAVGLFEDPAHPATLEMISGLSVVTKHDSEKCEVTGYSFAYCPVNSQRDIANSIAAGKH